MSLSEADLRKLTKEEVIALTLEYQEMIRLYLILTKNSEFRNGFQKN